LYVHRARRLVAGEAAVALAAALVAQQPTLVRYAAQVKPYAVDLAAGAALCLYAVRRLAPADREVSAARAASEASAANEPGAASEASLASGKSGDAGTVRRILGAA